MPINGGGGFAGEAGTETLADTDETHPPAFVNV